MPVSPLRNPRRKAPATEEAQAAAGLRALTKIAEQWHLSAADAMALLGVESRSTYYDLLKRARDSREVRGLSRDQLDRLSYVIGIYESIRVLFPHSRETRDGWVTRPNTSTLFGGKPPLEIMRSGMIGLYQTFAHLAAVRGTGLIA
ncbi:MAG: antitoxin Xre-like helix-turn-helix domain-containing protein [Gemmatimonadaceae bacterium]